MVRWEHGRPLPLAVDLRPSTFDLQPFNPCNPCNQWTTPAVVVFRSLIRDIRVIRGHFPFGFRIFGDRGVLPRVVKVAEDHGPGGRERRSALRQGSLRQGSGQDDRPLNTWDWPRGVHCGFLERKRQRMSYLLFWFCLSLESI